MQNHEQYEKIIKLFVEWNERRIKDYEFASKVVGLIGTDYNTASAELFEEIQSCGSVENK